MFTLIGAIVIISLISFFSAYKIIKIKNTILRNISIFFLPLIISIIFYFFPCLYQLNCDEYFSLWAGVFFIPAFVSGVIAMVFGIYFFKWKYDVKK